MNKFRVIWFDTVEIFKINSLVNLNQTLTNNKLCGYLRNNIKNILYKFDGEFRFST